MSAYRRAAALGQGAQWVHDNMNVANFRADESNKATLALMRHNDGVQQELRRQTKADVKASQARVDDSSRYSPTTTARLASAAKTRDAAVPEHEAAMTNFSRIHAAVGELNC
jgi:hypothetical protein